MGYYKKITIQPGDRYGDLIILERYGTAKNGQPLWRCKCLLCENDNAIIASNKLRDKKNPKTNCGCKKKYNKTLMLPGQKFGKLTVIKEDPVRNSDRKIKYICQCECGNTISVIGTSLRSGNTQSCGCLHQSLGELAIAQLLDKNNIEYKKEFIIKELQTFTHGFPRFDFAIFLNNKLKFLLEFQGKQHFMLNNPMGKDQRERTDILKFNYCKNNNIKLFYINYNDNIEKKLLRILKNEELL